MKIRLEPENLNTPNGASVDEAFPPDEARRILDEFSGFSIGHLFISSFAVTRIP